MRQFLNYQIIELDQVDSTNNYSESLLKVNPETDHIVISAAYQRNGRGQGENQWLSEAGKNLLVSFIYAPHFLQPAMQFLLNKAVALACIDFLSELAAGHPFRIKWPNDLYTGNRKTGGILISNTFIGDRFGSTVIGVGININQKNFPIGLPNPTSLILLIKNETAIEAALHLLIQKMDNRYMQLQTGQFLKLDDEYRALLLGLDQLRQFRTGKESFSGTIKDVDSSGRLILKRISGIHQAFSHHEIEFLF